MKELGLYIHIPFCKQKCAYCDFYSLPCYNTYGKRYIDALCKQIEKESEGYKEHVIDTVFLGGGTPSLLNADDITRLINTVKKELKLTQDCEITIEANPCTLTREKLNTYHSLGINRLSIGLQSANDNELSYLGRLHTVEDFLSAYELARLCGFENISVDLMYGIPRQSVDSLKNTLDTVCALNPEHVSAYCLKIEENTPFGRKKDTLPLPNEDEEYEMYSLICDVLNKNGYEQYEISNFAKKGKRCQHNLKYWLSKEYIGFGPGAHSFFDGRRYCYKSDIFEYVCAIECGDMPHKIYENDSESKHVSSQNDKTDEYLMLKMRLVDGISENEFSKRFKKSLLSTYPELLKYVKTGHIINENGRYYFTRDGFFVSNYILSDILKLD